MRILLLFLFLGLFGCSSVKVHQNGKYFTKTKIKKSKKPTKTDMYFITGNHLNPEVWMDTKGRYFYYKDIIWPFGEKKVYLKIKK